jgi:hypothetical protein
MMDTLISTMDAIIIVRSKLDGTAQGSFSSKKLTSVCHAPKVASIATIYSLNFAQHATTRHMS